MWSFHFSWPGLLRFSFTQLLYSLSRESWISCLHYGSRYVSNSVEGWCFAFGSARIGADAMARSETSRLIRKVDSLRMFFCHSIFHFPSPPPPPHTVPPCRDTPSVYNSESLRQSVPRSVRSGGGWAEVTWCRDGGEEWKVGACLTQAVMGE